MGRGIRGTERRSNSRRVRKNTMKRKLMRRKSKKRKSKKRKPMKRGNRRMRGGYFGENVIVSMGKLVDSSKNQNFLDILKSGLPYMGGLDFTKGKKMHIYERSL